MSESQKDTMSECQKDNYKVKTVKINNAVINQIGKYNKDESVKFVGMPIDKHLTWKE